MKAAIGLALAGAMLCAAVVWSTALAQSSDIPYPMTRPAGPGGGPTPVSVDVFIMDIDAVDDLNQHFMVDMFIGLRWQDPRLAQPNATAEMGPRIVRRDEIWSPKLIAINDRGLTAKFPLDLEVSADGEVAYRQRLYGPLAVDLEFREFPFDRQILPIEIISYRYDSDQLDFSANATLSGEAQMFSAEGWTFTLMEPRTDTFDAPGKIEPRQRLNFFVAAERDSRYYVLTMIVPMTLIVLMAWAVFWLPPDIVPSRIAVSTAAIFSLIAFGFSIRLSLPPVSYMTRADIFVLGSTVLVFAALAAVVIGSRQANRGAVDRAESLNRIARPAYLAVLALIALLSLVL